MPLRASLSLLAAVAAAATTPALAAECRAIAESPALLIELYTSEGCSSCPPADRWLSTLPDTATSGNVRIVPLSLHVPYWDYIGWRDRFASPRFEQRQREAAQRARTTLVYTPQVMVNGRDYRAWRPLGLQPAIAEAAARPVRATLSLHAITGKDSIDADLSGTGPTGSRVVLARYENALASDVKRGENAGVRLEHERVVRYWQPLGTIGADGHFAFRHAVPRDADIRDAHSGLVAFVEAAGSGEVIQAVSLPHCNG